MKQAIVVGSGAGGATVAKELQGRYRVTVLEAGGPFRPFTGNLELIEKLKKTGLLFDERMIQLLFPAMKVRKTGDRTVLVNGLGTGGTTTISTANAVRKDYDLKKIGINLDAEYTELENEIPISAGHEKYWRESTRQVYQVCREMDLGPAVTPKMVDFKKCIRCGRCVLGCAQGAKWDSRHFLDRALENGAGLVTGCKVRKIVIKNGKAAGVQAVTGRRSRFYPADLVILAAGGLATPVILQNSGIPVKENLFVDPVLCVAANWPGCRQDHELPMPFIVQRDGFIISPYFDFLSFFFNGRWKTPARNIFSLQIKMADTNRGSVSGKGIQKVLTPADRQKLDEGVALCREIFHRLGISDDSIFTGTVNAGHPGGMLPLTEDESETLHHRILPENVYVADATLLPDSLGNPPSFTIMALAKRISRLIR
ncbi:MAG: GMC family oxidoreductase [Dehalococcoidales bacterium]|nr:GMC family oxidoreductase [Dehalococcoidales bacterium]